MITSKRANNYKINKIIDEILQILNHINVKTRHCFREANKVADQLAKIGSTSDVGSFYYSFQQLPTGVKGPYHLDKS